MPPAEVAWAELGGRMERKKQETMEEKAQGELNPKEQAVAAQVSYALHALASYEPGEQEAVAQAAHDAGLIVTAIQRTKRRHLRQSCVTAVILTVWLWYCIECATPVVSYIIGLFWGAKETYQAYLQYLMPLLCSVGHLSGIVVGVMIYYYNGSKQCHEMGGHIQIGRLKIATRILVAIGLLLATELIVLISARQGGTIVTWCNFLVVANWTAFTTTLLGYLLTTFSIMTFFVSRRQMLEDEKRKLGIFD